MKTKNMVLAGLGLAAAGAVYLLYRTERGKEMRKTLADNISNWRDSLTELAKENGDGLDHAAKNLKSNAARHVTTMAAKA